jgi:hypothetical protein
VVPLSTGKFFGSLTDEQHSIFSNLEKMRRESREAMERFEEEMKKHMSKWGGLLTFFFFFSFSFLV